MKRIFYVCLILTTTLVSFTACTKQYNENYNYLPGVSYVYAVYSNQWTQIEPKVFRYEIEMEDLDKAYVENGDVSVAINFELGPKTYEKIPATFGDFIFTYNYSLGIVRVFAEYRGLGTPYKPDDMDIKVVLTDAEVGN